MKKRMSILSLLFCVSIFSVNAITPPINSFQEEAKIYNVNVDQFAKLVKANKGIVLDVRTPGEWEEGTIADATKINYYDSDFAQQIEKLNKDEPVLVYCKKGGRSAGAAEILKEKGFTKVFNLEGGITAWKEAGKEVNK